MDFEAKKGTLSNERCVSTLKESHAALILIASDLVSGVSRLKEIKNQISEFSEIRAISSIYKKFLNSRSEDLNSELVVVIKIDTELETSQLFKKIKSRENKRSHQQITDDESWLLLCYDHEVRMFPGQNLPSPMLHTDRLALRCASEVWGSYEHPVLGKTLSELIQSDEPLDQVDFYAQGSSL